MGLDITAFCGLKKIDALFDSGGEPVNPVAREEIENYFKPCVSRDFPTRADDLEHDGVYLYADSFGFRAGSYGGYNGWRETLAKLVGYPALPFERIEGYKPSTVMSHQIGACNADSGPFYELLYFSYCEGTIGPKTSAKLAKDFAEWDEKAKALDAPFFYEKYCDWRKAFEMAAQDGAVDFH